jgi:hypothetical protein
MKRPIKHSKFLAITERMLIDSMPVPWSGCHLWLRTVNNGGYGMTSWQGKQILAHRAAWLSVNGPIPVGMCVLHRCDVRTCVNPEHLFLGTIQDNNKDRDAKGHMLAARGERAGKAKLTNVQVLAIRADTRRQAMIAADYGIAACSVSQIKARKLWRHL